MKSNILIPSYLEIMKTSQGYMVLNNQKDEYLEDYQGNNLFDSKVEALKVIEEFLKQDHQ